jgi:hypothetical protein
MILVRPQRFSGNRWRRSFVTSMSFLSATADFVDRLADFALNDSCGNSLVTFLAPSHEFKNPLASNRMMHCRFVVRWKNFGHDFSLELELYALAPWPQRAD